MLLATTKELNQSMGTNSDYIEVKLNVYEYRCYNDGSIQ
jgi:hypothetical protein